MSELQKRMQLAEEMQDASEVQDGVAPLCGDGTGDQDSNGVQMLASHQLGAASEALTDVINANSTAKEASQQGEYTGDSIGERQRAARLAHMAAWEAGSSAMHEAAGSSAMHEAAASSVTPASMTASSTMHTAPAASSTMHAVTHGLAPPMPPGPPVPAGRWVAPCGGQLPCDKPFHSLKGFEQQMVLELGFSKKTWNQDKWHRVRTGSWHELDADAMRCVRMLGFTSESWKAPSRPAAMSEQPCSACGQLRPGRLFSTSQLSKGACMQRCTPCVRNERPAGAETASTAAALPPPPGPPPPKRKEREALARVEDQLRAEPAGKRRRADEGEGGESDEEVGWQIDVTPSPWAEPGVVQPRDMAPEARPAERGTHNSSSIKCEGQNQHGERQCDHPLEPCQLERWQYELQQALGTEPIAPRSSNQSLLATALAEPSVCILFALGPAGCGKTLLAVREGLTQLASGAVDQLLLLRPAVTTGGEEIGFLPGSVDSKVSPYATPGVEAIDRLTRPGCAQSLKRRGALMLDAFAFLRGRSLYRTFVIADEMQNSSLEQIKCLLTRPESESGTKVCVLGDPTQRDLRDLGPSGASASGVAPVRNGALQPCALQLCADEVGRHGSPAMASVSLGHQDVQRGGAVVKEVIDMFARIDSAHGIGSVCAASATALSTGV